MGGGGSCTFNACALLSSSVVGQALQTMYGAGTESDTPGQGGLPNAYACEYRSADGHTFVNLSISCNVANLQNNQSLYNSFYQGVSNTPVSLSGTDAAFWVPSTQDGGSTLGSGFLNVFFGGHSEFTITLFVYSGSPVDGQAAATQMAQEVVKNLRL